MLMVWLPYPNLRLSVHCLSAFHLGKQFADSVTILRVLAGHNGGGHGKFVTTTSAWGHNPESLLVYSSFAHTELYKRGWTRDHPNPRTPEGKKHFKLPGEWYTDEYQVPDWVGVERIHASHRSYLITKDREWYSQFAWTEYESRVIVWPKKLPQPGDTLVHQDGRIAYTHEYLSNGNISILSDGKLESVSRKDVYLGVWQRAIEKE